MAVIQYTAIVNQVRGKLNGSVFNKSANGYTLTSKGQPPATITVDQSSSRARFKSAQQNWKLLSESDRSAWSLFAANNPNRDRFGNETILSGYNKYMECTINALVLGSFIQYPLNTDPVPPAPFDDLEITSLTLNFYPDGTRAFVITYNIINPISANKMFAFEVGLPMSSGVTNYTKSYRFMGFVQSSGAGTTGLMTSRPLPPSWVYRDTDRVAVRLRYYVPFRGVIGYETIAYVSLSGVPDITMFTSDKYSGTQPFVFNIAFFNKGVIDGVNYRFEARSQVGVGSCPLTPLTNSVNTAFTSDLFDTGTFTRTAAVASGSCATVEARIVHVPTGDIVSLQFFNINNI